MNVYWLEQTAGGVPIGNEWLSAGERARLDALRIPKRRADWRLGRWTAKRAISAYLNLPLDAEALAALELRPAPSGEPKLFRYDMPVPVALSLSHCARAALCAVAPAAAGVGCDVETVEPRSPAFLADYFTDTEQALVAQTSSASRDRVLTLLWSAKESALKALGCGLRVDTRSVDAVPADFLSAHDGQWSRVSATHSGGATFCGWWRASRGLVWTIVADPPPLALVPCSPDRVDARYARAGLR